MRYLLITEFGEAYKKNDLTDDDYSSANAGVLDLFDCENEKQWHTTDEKWFDIEDCDF